MPEGALQRAVELLHRLGEEPVQRTVAELAGDAGMPTSTAYRLLAELEAHGLVARGPDRTLALGTRLVALGRAAEAGLHERLVAPAVALMEELSHEVGETVILTAPCGLEAIVLHAVETERHSVRLSYPRFRRAPMHRGASGKVLAAHLERAELARLVAAAGRSGLLDELEQIRANGFAFTAGELDAGAAAVAAPVLDRRGRILAGLSIAGPEPRVVADVPGTAGAVVRAAERIQRAQTG
ncbi:MAG TPA: IclR family transcriptional regulator [Solirubrobacteraceae bacterium]|jgi:DNA-binding IclR family transcriptional regulator|nr:IclR family transcriptional regulator [Solirubrobacteraceae bacterium]